MNCQNTPCSPPRTAHWSLLLAIILVVAGCDGRRSRTNDPVGRPASPSRARPSIAPSRTIDGIVVSGNAPVAEARVRIKGTDVWTVTDQRGRFSLPVGRRSDSIRITAAHPDYYIAGDDYRGRSLRLALRRIPADDSEKYRWISPLPDPDQPTQCGNCHPKMYEQWRGDAHARAATNQRFLDLYGIASPNALAAPDGKSASAPGRPNAKEAEATGAYRWDLQHAHPYGRGVCLACHAPSSPLAELGTGDIRTVDVVAKQGVHCDFCHKVVDVRGERIGWTHGRFGLVLRRPAEGQLFAGPLDDVDRGEDVYRPIMRESRFCASCHEGVVFGVHVYQTYSEWLVSPAARDGKQCQDCHMTPDGHTRRIAQTPEAIERDPSQVSQHRFLPDGKLVMLRNCLKVDLKETDRADQQSWQVTLRAHDVGHAVPTGFVDRHLILLVQAVDRQGEEVPLGDGPVLPRSAGSLSGKAGALLGRQLFDADGYAPVPFWQPVDRWSDTRLLPDQPRTFVFRFVRPVATVRVRLIYRPFWESVREAKGWENRELLIFDQSESI